MVFLDTCIWIELCGVKSPTTSNEIKQANMASTLLKKLMQNKETIVTCDEQLLEIISAVEKIKLKEYNRIAKQNGGSGCGNIKDFRNNRKTEFNSAKILCRNVIEDEKYFADIHNCAYSIDDILSRIDVADINDCIYYDYCKNNKIEFYTFDGDIEKLGKIGIVHILK